METKSNHQVNIVRVPAARVHTNADSLELLDIGGYQVVVKKGQFKEGDLAVYIQPDSVVPQIEPFRFIWNDYVGIDGAVPERRRRITVRKFRKEWSEGLLLPLSDFRDSYNPKFEPLDWKENEDISELLGITHYDPEILESTKGNTANAPRRKYPKTLRGWFFFLLYKLGFRTRQLTEELALPLPVYDVDAYKNYVNIIEANEMVIATEKIHGSNARFVFFDGKMYAGSRTQWKAPGNTVWHKALEQNPWIEKWCREWPGWALYGEVTPTQKGFNYGCENGEVKLFVFDIRTPDGWGDYSLRFAYPELNWVPMIATTSLCKVVGEHMETGPSLVPGTKHVREGMVVKPLEERHHHRLGRVQLKIVSNEFLEKDSK